MLTTSRGKLARIYVHVGVERKISNAKVRICQGAIDQLNSDPNMPQQQKLEMQLNIYSRLSTAEKKAIKWVSIFNKIPRYISVRPRKP